MSEILMMFSYVTSAYERKLTNGWGGGRGGWAELNQPEYIKKKKKERGTLPAIMLVSQEPLGELGCDLYVFLKRGAHKQR